MPNKTTDEPAKATSSGARLKSEEKMRTSAEAYLRGSADVSVHYMYIYGVCYSYELGLITFLVQFRLS